jgi:polyisoprenoid-binding protein YceI
MFRPKHFAIAATLLAATACDNDPGSGKTSATVAEPQRVASPAVSARSATYVFSNIDSEVGFVGAKITRKHDGSFRSFRGTVQLVDGDPQKSSVKAEIDTASIMADEDRLTGHLKSPDFFDVQRYPQATFTSTSVRAGAADGATHTVTGNLELHGVTKSISFPARIGITGDAVAVDAEFVIDRKDFGIAYPGAPDDLIKDDVLIKLKIRAKGGAV